MTYTIVALPEPGALKKLNNIKNILYTNDFRYTKKECKEHAHITLLQLQQLGLQIKKDIIKGEALYYYPTFRGKNVNNSGNS